MLGGRGGGLQPPTFRASQSFLAVRGMWAKSAFTKVSTCAWVCACFFCFVCLFFFFIYFNLGRRGKTIFFQTVCADNNPEQH